MARKKYKEEANPDVGFFFFKQKTAYDITGQNKASEESFRHALYLAIDVTNNRVQHAADHTNPLRKQYFDKSGDREVLDLNAPEKED